MAYLGRDELDEFLREDRRERQKIPPEPPPGGGGEEEEEDKDIEKTCEQKKEECYEKASHTLPSEAAERKRKECDKAYKKCLEEQGEEDEEDEDGGGGGGGGGGQQFKWSPEIQALLNRILQKANELLDQPRGLSEEERAAIYNRAFEQTKAMERPTIQSRIDAISRIGMLGSPYAEREVEEVQRTTPQILANMQRDIGISETERRFDETMKSYQMVMQFLGQGLSSEQIAEALNAARRGEGTDALTAILQYWLGMYGNQGNSFWQWLINQ